MTVEILEIHGRKVMGVTKEVDPERVCSVWKCDGKYYMVNEKTKNVSSM